MRCKPHLNQLTNADGVTQLYQHSVIHSVKRASYVLCLQRHDSLCVDYSNLVRLHSQRSTGEMCCYGLVTYFPYAVFTLYMQPGYKLYPLVSLVAIYMYPASATNCRRSYMYPLVSASRTLLRTCIRRHVDGYKLLVKDTCIRATHIWCKRGFRCHDV